MNAKKAGVMIVVVVMLISLVSLPAWARSAQHYRWEGVAIGIGAAIIGSAILDSCCHPRYGAYAYNYPPPPPRRHGHWTHKKTWVAPTYKNAWNPAHYNRRGEWVPGGWISIQERSGYWTSERVWISRW
ncbi:MAG: hypothetical protein U9R20_05140 [Thermodesulfobacteriota bacterium]|nr:hypothetical protein [Thermodesulfobacteriota bacterium]